MTGAPDGLTMSVIVPAYNAGDNLVKCVKSVREQIGISGDDVEIIVVDDGSRDGSAERVADLVDCLIRTDKNRGAAAARNRGATEAHGDILVFVDADVLLLPDALSFLYRAFYEDASLDAAVGRYSASPAAPGLVNAYHNAFTRYHHDLSPREIDWFWGALGAVKKKSFFDVGGFDERYEGASAEDMEFGRELHKCGCKTVYVPEAQGAHAHDFSLKSMLINDYKKAVLGTKLRLKGRLPRRAPGFAGGRNLATSVLALVFAGLVISAPFHAMAGVTAVFTVCLLSMINAPYYSYLAGLSGPRHMLLCLPLHWLQFIVILAGGVMGAAGHMAGRDTFGRPGWI